MDSMILFIACFADDLKISKCRQIRQRDAPVRHQLYTAEPAERRVPYTLARLCKKCGGLFVLLSTVYRTICLVILRLESAVRHSPCPQEDAPFALIQLN
jgi:hypothetical protein